MAMNPAGPAAEPMTVVVAAMSENVPAWSAMNENVATGSAMNGDVTARSAMSCEMRPMRPTAAVTSAMGSGPCRSAGGGDRQSGHASGRERINSDRCRHRQRALQQSVTSMPGHVVFPFAM